MDKKHMVKLEGICKSFLTDEVETLALSHIDLTIKKGEFLAITGPSGCGKSTLLSLIGLLDTSSKGRYQLAGHDVSDLTRDQRALIRNKEIGFVFQSFNLISDLTVAENVQLPLSYRGDLNQLQIDAKVREALEKVDMLHRAKHFPSQLSGGQQQRVAVARAIAGEPAVILADEPTGNLDSKNAKAVMAILDQLHDEGATICMVTHDPRSAERAQRIIEVYDGKIVSDQQTMPLSAIAI
ncbi:ABC transporter, ATP-binding protein [Shewanella piezotolerans WP3]|uniref:ABC transporter, ATP-binding protein n=1 Tax=Shewanella piezotolerans (strain WP3 / JCM 13877) TaxID=225849 RepID=B8CRM4_SHEPW|nr:ABC transporter ATP-binding protein [Shewanella piezotolerans]ACJ30032.1 ABC transporter, ATP-binding protein [Shewanella piezotolerans WP3]